MPSSTSYMSDDIIKREIMKEKACTFEFSPVEVSMVEKMLLQLSDDTSPGIDNMDGTFLKVVAKELSIPICHIFNRCLASSLCPILWKEAKVIPLSKDRKAAFCGANSRPISLLPVLSKMLERIVFYQIQQYFLSNQLKSSRNCKYKLATCCVSLCV